jgi:hypothetical protein
MYTALIQGLVFFSVAIFSYYAWKRYKNQDYLWFTIISVSGLVLKVWNYFSIYMFTLPIEIRVVSDGISILIWISFILAVLKMVFCLQKSPKHKAD